MTMKGNIEGEWTLGGHKLLKDLVALLKKEEEKTIKTDKKNVGFPDFLVVDMRTGSTVRLHGKYVRNANHVQKVKMKRPSRLVEAILMKIISQMDGGPTALKDVMEKVKFTADGADDIEGMYANWIEQYGSYVQELEALLEHYLGTTLTECSGQTRIAAEIVPKDMLGLVSTEALEGFARAFTQKVEVEADEQ
tara:strand:+ start:335 stop:913 length:579 start_codon:yes stop_codon:yes gene_type:complete